MSAAKGFIAGVRARPVNRAHLARKDNATGLHMNINTTYSPPIATAAANLGKGAAAAASEQAADPAKPVFGFENPDKAASTYFSPEARDGETLQRMQAESARPVSAVASAYAPGEAALAPPMVKLLA